jgi:hypothetical protein
VNRRLEPKIIFVPLFLGPLLFGVLFRDRRTGPPGPCVASLVQSRCPLLRRKHLRNNFLKLILVNKNYLMKGIRAGYLPVTQQTR